MQIKIKPTDTTSFKSKWEEGFYNNRTDLKTFLGDVEIKKMVYEPMTFQVNGETAKLSYTPDFYVLTDEDEVVMVEVKTSKRVRDFYYTRARIVAMKLAFPEFRWLIALPKKRGSKTEWKFEEI